MLKTFAVFLERVRGSLRMSFPQVDGLLFRFLTNEVRVLNEPACWRRCMCRWRSVWCGGSSSPCRSHARAAGEACVDRADRRRLSLNLLELHGPTVNQVLRGLQERGVVTLC